MRTTIQLLALFVAVSGMSACATIIHGTSQDIAIHSTPDSAAVTVDNLAIGHTPIVWKMSRKDDHLVTLTLDGYQPETVRITKGVSGWFFGNILIGGIVGIAVDAISGGMYELKPGQLQDALAKNGSTARVQKDGLYVLVVMEPQPGWTKIASLQPVR